MFTITRNFAPAHLLVRSRPAEEPLPEQKGRIDLTNQPETRLWKLAAKTIQPKLIRSELLVLSFFMAVVFLATVTSFQELSRLMKSNAIEHVTARALQGVNER